MKLLEGSWRLWEDRKLQDFSAKANCFITFSFNSRIVSSMLVWLYCKVVEKQELHPLYVRQMITPQHTVKLKPVQFGVIVLTTSSGIMDHEEARRKKIGGKVPPLPPVLSINLLLMMQCAAKMQSPSVQSLSLEVQVAYNRHFCRWICNNVHVFVSHISYTCNFTMLGKKLT